MSPKNATILQQGKELLWQSQICIGFNNINKKKMPPNWITTRSLMQLNIDMQMLKIAFIMLIGITKVALTNQL